MSHNSAPGAHNSHGSEKKGHDDEHGHDKKKEGDGHDDAHGKDEHGEGNHGHNDHGGHGGDSHGNNKKKVSYEARIPEKFLKEKKDFDAGKIKKFSYGAAFYGIHDGSDGHGHGGSDSGRHEGDHSHDFQKLSASDIDEIVTSAIPKEILDQQDELKAGTRKKFSFRSYFFRISDKGGRHEKKKNYASALKIPSVGAYELEHTLINSDELFFVKTQNGTYIGKYVELKDSQYTFIDFSGVTFSIDKENLGVTYTVYRMSDIEKSDAAKKFLASKRDANNSKH